MSDLYQTTLNLSSAMLHLSGVMPAGAVEQTVRQSQPAGGLPGISMQGIAGFSGILPGTYDVYRRISAHPTIALVMGMVKAPIAGNSWKWTKRDAQVKDEWIELIRTTMDPLRGSIVRDALRALEYGWAPFEKIWETRNGYKVLARLKPLSWDCTQVLIDNHGNVRGLVNQPPGQPKTELLDGKYFIYHVDGEAGNPYGRSRHENVRKEWCEAEQIRQRMAQYMRKIAGIVVQLHYPEGTSKDQAGADRPNQWLAQEVLDAVSQGKSVMFPNGFADTADIRMAYELAGKSQWNLSSFDPGHGDYAPGMKTILEYYDALLFRGWLRPERSGLESHHGSRADAQVHTDTGTLDCELIDRDLADAVNHGIVNDLLTQNFGEEARGAVYAEAAPIENDSVDIYKTLVNTLLENKETGSAVARKIDIDGILDALNVPVEQNQRGALADEINQETPQGSNETAPAPPGGQVLPLMGYDPNQARDKDGKWTSEGASSGNGSTTLDQGIKLDDPELEKSQIPKTYVVQPGDTLAKIAAKLTGDALNELDFGSNTNDPLTPGQVLNLPDSFREEMLQYQKELADFAARAKKRHDEHAAEIQALKKKMQDDDALATAHEAAKNESDAPAANGQPAHVKLVDDILNEAKDQVESEGLTPKDGEKYSQRVVDVFTKKIEIYRLDGRAIVTQWDSDHPEIDLHPRDFYSFLAVPKENDEEANEYFRQSAIARRHNDTLRRYLDGDITWKQALSSGNLVKGDEYNFLRVRVDDMPDVNGFDAMMMLLPGGVEVKTLKGVTALLGAVFTGTIAYEILKGRPLEEAIKQATLNLILVGVPVLLRRPARVPLLGETSGVLKEASEATKNIGPIQPGEITTLQDFDDRSAVGDNIEGHEIWQHKNLQTNGLATYRLSTVASQKNPVIALDKATHTAVTAIQRGLDAASQTPIQNIEANAKILRDGKIAASDVIDRLEQWAKNHAKSLGF